MIIMIMIMEIIISSLASPHGPRRGGAASAFPSPLMHETKEPPVSLEAGLVILVVMIKCK